MGQKSTKHVNDAMNDMVAKSVKPPALEEAERLLEVKRNQIFIEDDAFIGNPYALLGRVLEIRSKNGVCTSDVKDGYADFSAFPIPGIVVDENSKIKQPQQVKSFIVDTKLSTEVGVLNYLNASLDTESIFSVIISNQAVGLLNIQDGSYLNGVRAWVNDNQNIINDPSICHLLIVTGVVMKNIIRKKYKKFDVTLKGGGFGINFDGNLYTSAEDYSLDIRFGLSYLKIPIPNKTELIANDLRVGDQLITNRDVGGFFETGMLKGLRINQMNSDIKLDLINVMSEPTDDERAFINKVQYRK
ncbi:hypothetical protein [Parapedobacter defluvii]|uniref:hypothetical protein n=1 Tax=Parapedobacter defluvii TaxID=2045106 RepID=UPI003340A2D9